MRTSCTPLLLLGILGALTPFLRADDDRGRPRVTLYEHADFRGASYTLRAGEVLENLTRARFSNGTAMNDRISSIEIHGGAQVIVYQDAGFRGERKRFVHSVGNLHDSAPGWNDAISSLQVDRAHGDRDRDPDRREAGFRRADEIIRRAYREILRRDPDERGLQNYRRHLVNDGWTEEQLRHSLREGREFQEVADRIIASAYRDLLGRDPSRRELRKLREQMVERGSSEEDVREAIRHTDEFRMRRKLEAGG